jgi:hypothetical protein
VFRSSQTDDGIVFDKPDSTRIKSMMIRFILLIILALFLNSCASQSRLIESVIPERKNESFRLTQNVQAKPVDQESGLRQFALIASYVYKIDENNKSAVSLEFTAKSTAHANNPDSLIILILDGEKFKIPPSTIHIKGETPSGAEVRSNNSEIQTTRFLIPESLWSSIVYTETIKHRLYIEKEEFQIVLNRSKTKELNSFFETALKKRDASIAPWPAGYKKW